MSFFDHLKDFNLSNKKKLNKTENGILSVLEFRRLVEHERQRADRNQHQFSLVLFALGASQKDDSIARNIIGTISRRVRNVDALGWYDEKRLGIMLPYTSTEGATRLIENLLDALDPEIPKPVCDIFTYPAKEVANN
jgi:hypothetical protein